MDYDLKVVIDVVDQDNGFSLTGLPIYAPDEMISEINKPFSFTIEKENEESINNFESVNTVEESSCYMVEDDNDESIGTGQLLYYGVIENRHDAKKGDFSVSQTGLMTEDTEIAGEVKE